MEKEDIRLKHVILHILDNTVGMPVLSESELRFGPDLSEFIREHIAKIASGDDSRECHFYESESEIFHMLENYREEDFVPVSRDMATLLYEIMDSNVDIPSADLIIAEYTVAGEEYLAILKMNYKSQYTHRTLSGEDGNQNELFLHKSLLPSEGQRLSEAALIRMSDLAIWVIEKKYEINGEKTNYFSFLFLKCSAHLSHKAKLNIVNKAVERAQKAGREDENIFEEQMRAKNIIRQTLQEEGSFKVEELADRIFADEPVRRQEFRDQMEKYELVKEEVRPRSETTLRKYETQRLYTDNGIEIKIPMELYNNPGTVEFITDPDGTVSVLIKNIEHLEAK